MTLCEALDWCRENKASVYFGKDTTAIVSIKGKAVGATLEEAVAKLVPSETVAKAAKSGFNFQGD